LVAPALPVFFVSSEMLGEDFGREVGEGTVFYLN
jgi:hypothetical protein